MEHLDLVLKCLEQLDLTEQDIINFLLLLIDDWQIRLAVTKAMARMKKHPDKDNTVVNITQNTDNTQKS